MDDEKHVPSLRIKKKKKNFEAMENSTEENQNTKLPSKMKVFHLTRKKFATLDVTPDLSLQSYPINGKITLIFLLLSSFFICNLVFAFLEAKTFTEYTQSIYMGSLAVLIIFCLAIIVFNMEKLFEVINDVENIVNASE